MLELAPRFAPAWFLLGRAREALHRVTGAPEAHHGALRAYAAALDLDPRDELGARVHLAGLGSGDPLDALTPGYVRALFDAYASDFDRHLTQTLGYRAPAMIVEALGRLQAVPFPRALDLGCGTGLMGRALAGRVGRLAGVDLSPAMLAQARRTGLYEDLAESDLLAFLQAQPEESADLAVAADVLVYCGRLDPIFAAVGRVLTPAGLFAFTVQEGGNGGVSLGPDARFAHGEGHVRETALGSGLGVRHLARVSTRQDRDAAVPGLLVVLSREGAGP